MLTKIFKPSVCVWLIVLLLVVSICFVPFTTSYFLEGVIGPHIPTGTLLVIFPILLGVIYSIIISCEPDKKEKKQGFAIAYASIFAAFYALDIWAIVYAIIRMR